MTDKMIEVPRELLEELRDCASDCFHYESTLSYSRSTRVNFYEVLVEQCDALLRAAAQPEQDEPCPHCGQHPGDLTTAWLDGAHCSGQKLSDPAVQKRLAAQWGYVKPDDLEAMRRDAELLDWLEERVKESGQYGVSFDYVRFVEDGYVVAKGFRFMRGNYLSRRHPTIRDTIAAEKREGE